MSQNPDISAILAALGRNSTPEENSNPSQAPQTYPSAASPSNPLAGVALPQPTNSGNLDLSAIKPAASGNVSLADAIAKAKGVAAERAAARDSSRSYRRSRSRSPQRRESARDNYNPFRDERRDGRAANGRDRSVTPPTTQATFSPGRVSQTRTRSPPPKSDSTSEVITVESSSVGLIIGRGGENLRRVETDTGARVQFITGPESAGPLRQCRISGTRQQRADAKADIFRIVEEHPREQPSKPTPAPMPDPYAMPMSMSMAPAMASNLNQYGEVETTQKNGDKNVTMMVPDKTVGLIIGRGGETIRDIQERSACHVNITSENKSINGMRPVNLIGNRPAIDEARKLINDVVDSDTRSGPSQSAQYPHYPPPHQSYPPPTPSYGMAYADPYGAPPPHHQQPQSNPYDPSGGQSRSTDTITVPSEAVGMIIGKGGETIKDMQQSTGCKINVAPPAGPDINREIGLIGPRHAIDAGKRAIWEKVNAVREKQGGVWTRGGEVAGPPPSADPYSQQPAYYSQPPQTPYPQAHSVPPPQQDPYAPYGGYDAYMALWAQATGPGGQPGY